MAARYRQIIDNYNRHRQAFINEKLMPQEAELLAAQLAIAESLQRQASAPENKNAVTIGQLKIFDMNFKNIKKLSDFTLYLDIQASNGKQCALELDGECALRLMFFLKLLVGSKKEGLHYSENTLQELEGAVLKNAYLDLKYRTSSTAMHRSLNQRLKRRTEIKELIRNTARRHEPGRWVLLVSASQVYFDGHLSARDLSKL